MEELSTSTVAINSHKISINLSIIKNSLLLQLNNQKLKNIKEDKFLLIMVSVLRKIPSRMSIDLILKDQRKISSSGWTNKLS